MQYQYINRNHSNVSFKTDKEIAPAKEKVVSKTRVEPKAVVNKTALLELTRSEDRGISPKFLAKTDIPKKNPTKFLAKTDIPKKNPTDKTTTLSKLTLALERILARSDDEIEIKRLKLKITFVKSLKNKNTDVNQKIKISKLTQLFYAFCLKKMKTPEEKTITLFKQTIHLERNVEKSKMVKMHELRKFELKDFGFVNNLRNSTFVDNLEITKENLKKTIEGFKNELGKKDSIHQSRFDIQPKKVMEEKPLAAGRLITNVIHEILADSKSLKLNFTWEKAFEKVNTLNTLEQKMGYALEPQLIKNLKIADQEISNYEKIREAKRLVNHQLNLLKSDTLNIDNGNDNKFNPINGTVVLSSLVKSMREVKFLLGESLKDAKLKDFLETVKDDINKYNKAVQENEATLENQVNSIKTPRQIAASLNKDIKEFYEDAIAPYEKAAKKALNPILDDLKYLRASEIYPSDTVVVLQRNIENKAKKNDLI